jgi:hypothetical protein
VNSQNNDKCFSDVEIDSIYSKLVIGKYATQENTVLKEVIIISNQKNIEREKQISILKINEKNYALLDENYIKMQENLYRIIDEKEATLKSEKRKKPIIFIKGMGVGAILTTIGLLLL